MPNHLFCSFAFKKASKKTAGSDLDRAAQLLGSRKAGQQLVDKAREKNKKNWGKKKAPAKISFDDLSSASDASFSDVSGSGDESDTAAAAAVHVIASASDPSANLEVRQLISLKCEEIHWYPNVLSRLLLKCRNLLK